MNTSLLTPLKLTLQYCNTCNLDCIFCYGDCGAQTRKELSCEQWKEFISYLVANGFIHVFFEGGEPFSRPEFMEILEFTCPQMLVWVRTNGTLITREIAHRLKQIHVGTVLIDLHGATAATHDYLVGRNGSFEAARLAAVDLVNVGIPVFLLCILNRRNVAELQEYLRLATEIGAQKVGLLRLYPLGRAKRRWSELSLSLNETMDAIRSLMVPSGIKLMQSWHPNDGNCCWQNAAVNAWGDSIGCPYLREYVNYGNILSIPFLETWHHPLWKALRSGNVVDSCSDCTGTQKSRGGCRSTAFAFHGMWDAPDPFCQTLNKGVDLRVLPQRLL